MRGVLVRLTDVWVEILRRRSANATQGAYALPLQNLLGEMTAAALLLKSNIKFDGTLVLQVFGDGPVKLAVVEVQPDWGVRATATQSGTLSDAATLSQMVNVSGQGRCAITLDPRSRQLGQQAYQGVVSLAGQTQQSPVQFSEVLEQYMRQSEQLETKLVLAANDRLAAGLLIQRLPVQGVANLAGTAILPHERQTALEDDFQRIALLASSLKREELLTLDIQTILRRLFWQELVRQFEPSATVPRFACTCSQERVGNMILGLGLPEAQAIVQESGLIEVGCDFCGALYRFDAVDVVQLFQANPAVSSAALPIQ